MSKKSVKADHHNCKPAFRTHGSTAGSLYWNEILLEKESSLARIVEVWSNEKSPIKFCVPEVCIQRFWPSLKKHRRENQPGVWICQRLECFHTDPNRLVYRTAKTWGTDGTVTRCATTQIAHPFKALWINNTHLIYLYNAYWWQPYGTQNWPSPTTFSWTSLISVNYFSWSIRRFVRRIWLKLEANHIRGRVGAVLL